MNEKRKQVLAGCLCIGAVFTWSPGLLSARNADKLPRRLDLPAEAAWDGTAIELAPPSMDALPRETAITLEEAQPTRARVDSSPRDVSKVCAPLEPAASASVAPPSSVRDSDRRGRVLPPDTRDQDLLAALERSLSVVRSLSAERAPLDLEALARTWGRDVDARTATDESRPELSEIGSTPRSDESQLRKDSRK